MSNEWARTWGDLMEMVAFVGAMTVGVVIVMVVYKILFFNDKED